MAEDVVSEANRPLSEPSQRHPPVPSPPPPFVEVMCKSSGKVRRFAAGTEAGFALSLLNKKLDYGTPLAWLIEAVKEGEEPVSFSPKSVLVDYGDGWRLQTVIELEGLRREEGVRPTTMTSDGSRPVKRVSQPFSFLYAGKIIFAFIVIFLLAAIFTLALENLPRIIMLLNSSM